MIAERPLLDVQNLTLSAGCLPLVRAVSLSVAPGETLAVIGESGSGKTLLARAAIGLLPGGIVQTSGRVLFEGVDIASLSHRAMRRLRGPGIGMVFQEPMMSLNPTMTVGRQMAEGLGLHLRLGTAEIRRRSLAMLERVQIRRLPEVLDAYPHEFSGGMRQRIMVASVMLLRPRLLIADEPTTALDLLSQREVLDLMTALAREEGTATLLITHDLGVVERYAQRAVVMRGGERLDEGSVGALLRTSRVPYTRALFAAAHDTLPARVPLPPRPPVISVRGLAVRYPGRRGLVRRDAGLLAIQDVDIDVLQGEVVAVVGGSGSGKTTLGRALVGMLPIERGNIALSGRALATMTTQERRRALLSRQLVFQDPHSSLDPRQRVGSIVAEPLRHAPDLDVAQRALRVAETLEQVGLGGFEQRFPHALSGGQRQRVAIARAIVRRPDFLVADEPVSALDMTVRRQVLALFRSLQEQYGFACLFISHDLAAVSQVADRIVVMHEGRIVEEGACEDIMRNPAHSYTQALLAATPLAARGTAVPSVGRELKADLAQVALVTNPQAGWAARANAFCRPSCQKPQDREP